ncbi:MAG: IPT/TIG domain-containing protein [Polyangiales bacterium]
MKRLAAAVLVLVSLTRAPVASSQVHPAADRVTPRAGPPGTRVTFVGHGFLRGVAVYLGGALLPIVRRTPTRLVVRIPEGAQTGTLLVTWGDEEEAAGAFVVTTPRPAVGGAGPPR